MKHSKRSKLTTEDVSNALRLRNVEQLYGFTSKEPLQFGRVGSSSIYFVKDEELPLNYVVEQMPLPKCPIETTLSLHWYVYKRQSTCAPTQITTRTHTSLVEAAIPQSAVHAPTHMKRTPICTHICIRCGGMASLPFVRLAIEGVQPAIPQNVSTKEGMHCTQSRKGHQRREIQTR